LSIIRSFCFCASLLAQPSFAQDARVQRERVFVQTHCAQCHAIGRTGASPLMIAPPFRELQKRYPVDTLAGALAKGIVTGHPTMPEFQLDIAQINDVIAYLKSIEQ
jgi:cytochrome c